jgi:uncharacterized protein with HEPN domain
MTGQGLSQDYLRDILDAMDKAASFVSGMSYEEFCRDERTAFAVIRALEIVGEAAKKVPAPWRRRYPAIPWKSLAGMRDKLIHDYVGVSLEVVWRTIRDDIPEVKPRLQLMLEEVSRQERES